MYERLMDLCGSTDTRTSQALQALISSINQMEHESGTTNPVPWLEAFGSSAWIL